MKKPLSEAIHDWNALLDRYDASDKEMWKVKENGSIFPVMEAPPVLQLLGVSLEKIHIFGSFFQHSMSGHKGMTLEVLRPIPEKLSDPFMIVRGNKTNSYVFAIELTDHYGASVVVPLEINKAIDGSSATASILNTAYGKTVSQASTEPSAKWFAKQIGG